MKSMKCPQCGAPAQVPAEQPVYRCTYCQQSFDTGFAPKAKPAEPIIIVNHVSHPTPGGSSWTWLAIVVPLFVIPLVAGVAFRNEVKALVGSGWSGKTTLRCGGNDEVTIEGVHAELPTSTAIVATGNCHLRVKDSQIRAFVAIEASGNAEIVIEGGSVEGSTSLVDASGNGRIEFRKTRVKGPTKRSGNARVTGT